MSPQEYGRSHTPDMRASYPNNRKKLPARYGEDRSSFGRLARSSTESAQDLFEGNRRRVTGQLRKKGDFSRHTHVVGDTADVALTWKWPDLGSDRRAAATSTWSRSGPAPNNGRGLPPQAGIGPTRPTT